MTRDELEKLDHELVTALVLVRRALARLNHSGAPSSTGIGAPGQGDTECDEKDENEFMDRTIEEAGRSDGASSSPQQTAARLLRRSRQRRRPNVLPMPLGNRAKATR
jgi:hypothetical protein